MPNEAKKREKRDLVAQWAFDCQPILNRLHLWLDDVEISWLHGKRIKEFTEDITFMEGHMERLMVMTAAVTALGTKLYGRYGGGADKDKKELNQVKKDADAISAYAMSESLWYASRQLPENHAIMVCLGEGLMPKSGETREMGSNPQLGFGRIYARPQVAKTLDQKVRGLLNDPSYGWEEFYQEVKQAGITIWGAAIDTLENTTRFAKGSATGPMTVLHLFNQPLRITKPYEGYMGNLFLPKKVSDVAASHSILLDFRTPRAKVMEAIEATYPGIKPENVHVWTLRGKNRIPRLGRLWEEWESIGAHLVDDGWKLPTGQEAFTDSGTYAPTYAVGTWEDEQGELHLFICDGYAASAEAMQAVSLAPLFDQDASLVVFTSKFGLSHEREQNVMALDPEAEDFARQLRVVAGQFFEPEDVEEYRDMIRDARDAGLPLQQRVLRASDFFPQKGWDVCAVSGYMCPDPYTGASGVESVEENSYRVTVRLATRRADKKIVFTFRLMKTPDEGRLVFNPLLIRFIYGEDYLNRPVKISDSGRIRNELQTLCSEALEYLPDQRIQIHFDRIPPEVISRKSQKILLDVLGWYKEHHPVWFSWLEIVGPGEG